MTQKKITSRLYGFARAAFAAAVLPVFFIYVMIAKPDYRIMNAAAHVVVPVGRAAGDLITWPFRAGGRMIRGAGELSALRHENEELRAELDAMRARGTECTVALLENERLNHELNIVRTAPRMAIAADVTHDVSALHHNTYFISKGARDGIEPGMVAVTFDGMLAGVVIDAAPSFARVRALNDSDSNIAVRIAGTGVYGFMRGTATYPQIGFFSDPEFQARAGLRLVTSGIGGVLPDGIPVGELKNQTDVKITAPDSVSRVMIYKFDDTGKY